MSIDIKRLKTDRIYWNEVAPEGATHFDPHDGAEAPWIRVTGDEYEAKGRGAWVPDHSGPFYKDAYIPRPTKPAEGEWVDGVPPVGTVCECLFNDGWHKVAVLAHHKNESWVKRPRGTHIVSEGLGNEFRPIKTPEQRQREELIKVISESDEMAYSFRPDDIADAIIDFYKERYNLEPK